MSSEQPLKSVYRSANISLRKADLARQNADDDEELYHLNQFAKTVRLTLQTHRLWERRKDDKDAVELVSKLPEMDARIRELGGTPYTPPDAAPPPRSDSAPSVLEAAATQLRVPGQASAAARGAAAARAATRGALLRRSRANSRTNSRAASPERTPPAPLAAPAPARPPPHHHPPRHLESARVPVKDDDDDAPGSPSSAEKYGARVQGEVARLFEEAEAVRIAALERKVEMMRARMDATSGAAHGVAGGLSPSKAPRSSMEVSAAMDPYRTLLPSASASVAAAIVSSGGSALAPPSGGFADRLQSIDAEVTRLRKHIADAAAATGTVTGTSFAQRLDDVEREVRETRRASLDKAAYVVAPAPESRAAPPADAAPIADAPGAWIRRGETEMSATPRAPRAGPVMAVGSSWLVKQLSPRTARPVPAPSRESPPPPPPPPPPPAPAIPSSPPRVTLPPAPDIPVPSTGPSAPASEPVATVPDSERKFKAPGPRIDESEATEAAKQKKKKKGTPAPTAAPPALAPEPPSPATLPPPTLPPATLPAPPDDLNAVAAAAAARAIESSLASSGAGSPTPGTRSGPGRPDAVLATMDGAKAAAVAAAEAAATAVSERVRRELRFVAERQDALTRRGEAEFNAVVAQVLPLHEETNALRTSLSQLEVRLDSVADHVASTDGVNMAASAAAVAAAAGAEVEALRAHVAKHQKASQDWTESAIAHYGQQAWDHTQRLLLERDQSEQERVKHLQSQLEESHRWQREFQRDVAEKFVQQESAVEAMRRQMMQMAAAMEDMQGELAQQGGQKQSQMNVIMQRLGALESAPPRHSGPHPAPGEAGPADGQEAVASTSAPDARLDTIEARLSTAEDLLGQTAMASARATAPIAEAVGDIVPEIHSLRDRLAKMEGLDYGKSLNTLYDRLSALEATGMPVAAQGTIGVEEIVPEIHSLRDRLAKMEGLDYGKSLNTLYDRLSTLEAMGTPVAAQGTIGIVDTSELEARIIRAESSAAAAAATEVQILKEKLSEFGMRLNRAEEVAAEAAEAATTTSPGTEATKKAVPGLRSRVAEMEVEVAARLSDVESRIAEVAETCVETAAFIAATPAPTRARGAGGSVRGSPRRHTPSPRKSPVPPESHASERITEERQVTLHEIALDAVAEVEDRLAVKIAEVEAKMFELANGVGGEYPTNVETEFASPAGVPVSPRSPGGGGRTPRSPGGGFGVRGELDAVKERLQELSDSFVQVDSIAVDNESLGRRVAELESLQQASAAASVANFNAHESKLAELADVVRRVENLEADGETSSELAVAMAGRVHEVKKEIAEIQNTKAIVSSVKSSVAAVQAKVSSLAAETAETIEAIRGRQSEMEAELRNVPGLVQSTTRKVSVEVDNLSAEVADLRKHRAADAERMVENEEQVRQAKAMASTAAYLDKENVAPRLNALESLDLKTLRQRLVDMEVMLLDAAMAGEEETETRIRERAEFEAGLTPREKFERRIDALEESKRTRARASVTASWGRAEKKQAEGIVIDGSSLNSAAVDAVKGEIENLQRRVEQIERDFVQSRVDGTTSDENAAAASANAEAASTAAISAAASAAGAAELVADEVEKLRRRLAAVEGRGGNMGTPGTPKTVAPRSPDSESRPRAPDSLPPPAEHPAESTMRGAFRGVTAEEAAEAAAALGLSSKGPAPVSPMAKAKTAAARARLAAQHEAAKLGIKLGDPSIKPLEDLAASMSPRVDHIDPVALAAAADRQLAAELATVCALVEREESRRLEIREDEMRSRVEGSSDRATDAVAVAETRAAQRRWEIAMESQLLRLRKAAHEAEERHAVAAAVVRGVDEVGPTQEVAARLSYVHGKVDAMLRAEGVRVERASRVGPEGQQPPWGAGPGLKSPGKVKAAEIYRHLAELERGVSALARTAPAGTVAAAVGVSRSMGKKNTEELVEVKSLRHMVRAVQTELGGLQKRLDAVDKRTTGAGRAEQDIYRAQMSEVRSDVKALKRGFAETRKMADDSLKRAIKSESTAAGAHAHAEELGAAVTAARGETARLRERVDALAHGADAGLRALDGKVERVKSSCRGAKATARMAEARAVALAGELGRVARHVGLDGVGEALRTGTLFQPPKEIKKRPTTLEALAAAPVVGLGTPGSAAVDEEDDDLFDLPSLAGDVGVGADASIAPPSPKAVDKSKRKVTWRANVDP